MPASSFNTAEKHLLAPPTEVHPNPRGSSVLRNVWITNISICKWAHRPSVASSMCSFIVPHNISPVFVDCVLQNWHITDCSRSESHTRILASLLLLRACDDVSTATANQTGPLSEITPAQMRAQKHSNNTVFTSASEACASSPAHVATHKLTDKHSLTWEQCRKYWRQAWSRELLTHTY